MHRIMMYLYTMYPKELLKGIIPTIILSLLAKNRKMYGYQIAKEVKELSDGKITIKEGSLYPTLHNLESEGLVSIETVSIGKRIRRYYALTESGINYQKEKLEEFEDFIATINKIVS